MWSLLLLHLSLGLPQPTASSWVRLRRVSSTPWNLSELRRRHHRLVYRLQHLKDQSTANCLVPPESTAPSLLRPSRDLLPWSQAPLPIRWPTPQEMLQRQGRPSVKAHCVSDNRIAQHIFRRLLAKGCHCHQDTIRTRSGIVKPRVVACGLPLARHRKNRLDLFSAYPWRILSMSLPLRIYLPSSFDASSTLRQRRLSRRKGYIG